MNELCCGNWKVHPGPSFYLDCAGVSLERCAHNVLGSVFVQLTSFGAPKVYLVPSVHQSYVPLSFIWLVAMMPLFRCHLHLLLLKVTHLSHF